MDVAPKSGLFNSDLQHYQVELYRLLLLYAVGLYGENPPFPPPTPSIALSLSFSTLKGERRRKARDTGAATRRQITALRKIT